MAEPSSPLLVTGLVALASSMLGPLLGPYALIVIASSIGAFVAAAEANTDGRRAVLLYVLRGAVFASCFAAICAEWLEQRFGWPAHSLLAAAAVGIGYQAHQVHRLVPAALRRFLSRKGAPDE